MTTLPPETQELLRRVDTVVFDIDGVLLDVSRSIRSVNCLSVPTYLRTLTDWLAPDDLLASQDIEYFKEAGGFNDDWDLTYAIVQLYLFKGVRYGNTDAAVLHLLSPTIPEYTAEIARRGGWLSAAETFLEELASPEELLRARAEYHPDRIRRIFQELWAGDLCVRIYGFAPEFFPGPGMIWQDRPLLDTSLVPTNIEIGVVTGRTLAEAQVALEMVGLADRIPLPGPRGITKDDGFYKPEPDGMRELLLRLGSRVALYIGDTIDDLRTVLAFRTLPEAEHITLLSAQVLTGTTPPAVASQLFARTDILAPDVNAALRLLTNRFGDPL